MQSSCYKVDLPGQNGIDCGDIFSFSDPRLLRNPQILPFITIPIPHRNHLNHKEILNFHTVKVYIYHQLDIHTLAKSTACLLFQQGGQLEIIYWCFWGCKEKRLSIIGWNWQMPCSRNLLNKIHMIEVVLRRHQNHIMTASVNDSTFVFFCHQKCFIIHLKPWRPDNYYVCSAKC